MSSTNPFRNTRIEYHILQSFPVTCLNRDDVGAPKTAIVGGNTRARVSSQCWKREVRLAMQDFDIKLGIRTKKIADFVAKASVERGASLEQGAECGKVISDAFSKDTLFFFSESEAKGFADYAQEKSFDSTKLNDKELQKVAKKTLNPAIDGLDIALFGRFDFPDKAGIVIQNSSEDEITAAAKKALAQIPGKLILSGGCEITPGTSENNVRALFSAI